MPKKPTRRKKISTEEIEEALKPEPEKKIDLSKTLPTGSTLLDLEISGGVTEEGGLPGGIIVEISGPSGVGKSAILSEVAGNCQLYGGQARFDDPEGRLNKEYSRIYGFDLEDENYYRPDTVREMFNGIWEWNPPNNDVINVSCEDSLAALSTEMEMEDVDKFGMKRAKDFSECLRKTCRLIAKNNWLILCSNQERETPSGITTAGGKAVPYYSSLRIRLSPFYPTSKIKKTTTINNVSIDKTIGIRTKCQIIKSSIDEPYRECPISIIFGYGIDDIRENLQYIKKYKGDSKYFIGDKSCSTIVKAIEFVEELEYEESLRQETITLWHEIQEALKVPRRKKTRLIK